MTLATAYVSDASCLNDSSSDICMWASESSSVEYNNEFESETVSVIREIDREIKSNDEVHKKLKDVTLLAVGDTSASCLFSPSGKKVLTELRKLISATPECEVITSWRELAGVLNFDNLTICSIKRTDPGDCMDSILKMFVEKSDAKLSDIVNAFYSIKRYDCLKVTAELFPALARSAVDDHDTYQRQEQLSGNNESVMQNLIGTVPESETTDQVIKAVKNVMHTSSKESQILVQAAPFISVNHNNIRAEPRISHKRKYLKKVLLTFTDDGREVAKRVKAALIAVKPLPIGVLTLGDHADRIQCNPYLIISHWIAKMDYIIPVLTEGYLEALGRRPDPQSQDLDSKFVRLIHDILTNEFVDNGCLNKRVRSVIPSQQKSAVFNHCHFKVDSLLKVFFIDSSLDVLIERITSSRKLHF